MAPQIPQGKALCKRHEHAGCIYDRREYTSCPFCTVQFMLNPRLREESPLKRDGVPEKENAEDIPEICC